MTSNKLVVKCGNFAVLVDLHVLPQGTSKDTSWFSDHEKEEVCKLLKDTIESRVTQHIESRKQQGQLKRKEYTQASPLFLKGKSLRIAAYFIKRWVNLRCIVKKQYRELHVFPDRFVVCVSPVEPVSNTWNTHTAAVEEPCCSKSEYFAEHEGNEECNILHLAPKQQIVLRNIVKKTKATKDASSEAAASGDRKVSPSLRLEGSDTVSKGNKHKTLPNMQCAAIHGTAGQAQNCINTTESSLELPVPEVENDVNPRQPCEASSQQKPQCTKRLKAQELSENLSWICESAVTEHNHRSGAAQLKRRRHSSEGKKTSCKKPDLRDDTFIQHNVCRNGEGPVKDATALPSQCHSTDRGDTKLPCEVTAAVNLAGAAPVHVKHQAMSVASSGPSVLRDNKLQEERTKSDNQTKKLKLQRSKKLP